jgi:O-antigen chain-terminating methyltransferase
LRNFYLDLSHEKPIPSETLKFLVEQAGFQQVSFHFSSPVEEDQKLQGDDQNTRKLNKLLYGYQEYAVIGIK